jgi:hypothetical protein
LQWECFGLGFTAMQIGEWLGAVCFWVLIASVGIARSLVPTKEKTRTNVGVAFSVVGWSALAVLLITITTLHKPESEPWSNLQKLPYLQKLWGWGGPIMADNEILFRKSEWHTFAVINGDHDSDSVMIMLSWKATLYTSDDFALDLPQSSLSLLEKQSSDPDVKFADVSGMAGPRNQRGRPFFLILIRHMAAKERRTITLELLDNQQPPPPPPTATSPVPPQINVPSGSQVAVNAEVVSWSGQSTALSKDGDLVEVPYQISEPITINRGITCFKRDNQLAACESKPFQQGEKRIVEGRYYVVLRSWKDKKNEQIPVRETT